MKKMVSFMMSAALMLTSIPVQVYAEDADTGIVVEETELVTEESTAPLTDAQDITEASTETILLQETQATETEALPDVESEDAIVTHPETEIDLIVETEQESETVGIAQTETVRMREEDTEPVSKSSYIEDEELIIEEGNDISYGIEQVDLENMDVMTSEEDGGTGFTYKLLEDGTAEITGYSGARDGDLIIPDVIDGHTVTKIGNNAFYGYTSATITIPESVTSIGDYAFYGYTGFNLTIPESVTSIGDYAFYYGPGAVETGRKLSLPKNITKLGRSAFFDSILIFGAEKLSPGDTGTLQVTGGIWDLDPNSPYPLVTWKSSNESVVKIDKNGIYTAVSAGEAIITATGYDSMCSESFTMTVLPERASGLDTIAPLVRRISFQPLVVKPGVIKLKVDLLEEDTGIVSFSGWFTRDDSDGILLPFDCDWQNAPKFSGTYEISVPVSSKQKSGEYYLSYFSIRDEAGNIRNYARGFRGDTEVWLEGSIGASIHINVNDGKNAILVQDDFNVAFQASISNPDITERLKEMPDGSTAMINFNQNNHMAKREWFETIRGTNKNLVLSNDGIQWMFNGKDITQVKDIDCAVNIQNTYDYDDGSTGALKLLFASNGVLPGKATVRVKSDYILSLYGVAQTLYLYFLKDDQMLQLEDMPQYFMDGSDHWCEFELTHNSTFILSGSELDSQREVKMSSIAITTTDLSVQKGKTLQLTAEVEPENAKNKALVWSSSDTSIATVDARGVVSGKKYGTATITAKAADGSGKSVQCKVKVGYGITYKLNSGKNSTKNPRAYYKSAVKLQNPTRKGYLFKGWYTDKKYKKKITKIASSSKKNLTLYAKWEKVKTGKAAISSLKNAAGKKATLKFKKVSKASGYEILYGTAKNLKGAKTVTSKKTTVTLKGLTKGKTYYAKVRAYRMDSVGNKVYGKYSSVKRVKITK